MDIKKSKYADLERKRVMFFQIGFIIALGVVLVAFEWTSKKSRAAELAWADDTVLEEEAPPITRQEEPKLTPPPLPKVSDIIIIVEDELELNEELEIHNSDMDENYEVDLSVLSMPDEEEAEQVFIIVEDMPEFPGGTKALLRYIAREVKYPVICQENGIEGMVSVSFVINEKGEVTQVKAIRGNDLNLEKEAVRVVKGMPRWQPGKQRGRPVKVAYTVPVRFRLQ
ncbi:MULTISPECIES: energy transducer TonB [unclassified Carboxylicivirga]|uniref:energy transducer TonB n=1 Tax=Carboxylicivirga TaxID=1628153 RepID=UPI003D3473AC